MRKILGLLVLVPALWSLPAWSATNYLLKIDTIEGESRLKGHEKWIEVENWSWGLTNTGSAGGGPGGGPGAGKTIFEDFTWTQLVDSSVIPIFLGVASGTVFPTATLDVLKSTGASAPVAYFQMIFSDVVLNSLHLNGTGNGAPPSANASLDYTAVTLRYRSQKSDGSFSSWVEGSFDRDARNSVQFNGDPAVVFGLLLAGGDVSLDVLPNVPSPVPEPQTWAMMLAGLLLASATAALRQRGRAKERRIS